MALTISLRPPAQLEEAGSGDWVLSTRIRQVPVGRVPSAIASALRGLRGSGGFVKDLEDAVRRSGGDGALASWYYYLGILERHSAVTYHVADHDDLLLRLVITSPYFTSDFPQIDPNTRYTLSRFAFARRQDHVLVVESPLSLARIELLSPDATSCFGLLARPITAADVSLQLSHRPRAVVGALLALLHGAGLLTSLSEDGTPGENGDPATEQWEFADALFHARSRRGRHDQPMGRTFPFRGRIAPEPVVKAPMSTAIVDLRRPTVDDHGTDWDLEKVLERRRSVRSHGAHPMTIDDLGAFLFRTARVKTLIPEDPDIRPFSTSHRPSPSGGACHPLELYLAVNSCRDLAPGVYHYDPSRHRLEALAASDRGLRDLFAGTPDPEPPSAPWQVLIIIAARFQRVSWKYRGISYATVLKDAGALMQTMYLVATAMDLAPCALGCGDAEFFARTIGTHYFEETSVGEFLLGAPGPRPDGPHDGETPP